MNKYILIVVTCLCPLFVFSQNVEVLGGFKADSVDVNSGLIRNAANPISPQDAATKAYVDEIVNRTYSIGLSPEQGGYIIWVSPNGKHGLVAETVDQSTNASHGNAQDFISNPNNHSADGANFRDWRMPTAYELNEMYLQKDNIGGFSTGDYLHSSGSSGNLINFSFGLEGSTLKGTAASVRSVRTF